jgi:long-chain acyl-CoA synthetase
VTDEQHTTAGMLRHWARVQPDHVALRWGDEQLTYRELDERASRVANALRAIGVRAGDHVAYLDKNSPEQVEVLFGAAKLNAVPTPVNFRLAPPEIAVIVTDADAKVFVIGDEFVDVLDKISADLGAIPIVVIGDADDRTTFAEWRDEHPADDPMVPQAQEDVAYQLYSSGTTGRPKGVQLTQANLQTGVSLYPDVMGLGPDSISLVAMPLFHIGGGGWLLAGVAVGATNVLVRDIVPNDLVVLIERERITHAFLVPAALQFMLAVPGIEERDFSALGSFLYGASPISEQVLAASIRTFGCQFLQAYGLTETTGTVVLLPPEDHDLDGPNTHRLRAAGKPIPGSEIRVVDAATGEDAPVGEVGEIWIRSATVMKGYWNLPEATEEAIRPGGWFRSGDAGYLDEDGYLYLYDRVKDMIVSGGENVYPAEVENVLMAHPAVADAAVIGVPHDKWGETPKAMVVRTPDDAGAAVTDDELLAHCRERLATFKCPTSVDWVDALPRNPSGKILKKDLREPFWVGRERRVG